MVFQIATQRKVRTHRRAILRRCQSSRAILHRRRPCRQRRASGGGEIGRALRAIAEREPRDHAPHAARRIGRIGISVWPIDRESICRPRDNRRMLRHGSRALGVAISRRIVVHMVAELMPQRDRLHMIVIVIPRLMRQRGIEGHALDRIGISSPDSVARIYLRARGVHIRKRIAIIEKRHSVHKPANRPAARLRLRRRHRRIARDAINCGGVRRIIREQVRLRRVQIPRPHHVRSQPGRTDIHPGHRGVDLVHVRVSRIRLRASPAGPGGGRRPCRLIGHGREDARVFPGVVSEPRVQQWICVSHGETCGEAEEKAFHRETERVHTALTPARRCAC